MPETNMNWNMLPIDERLNYINAQIDYAKSSNDKVLEEYWESNLEKFNELKPIVDNVFKTVEKPNDLNKSIEDLQIELTKISDDYRLMLKDGIIDKEELERLIKQMNVLAEKTVILKESTSNPSGINIIDSISKIINEELTKMRLVLANS